MSWATLIADIRRTSERDDLIAKLLTELVKIRGARETYRREANAQRKRAEMWKKRATAAEWGLAQKRRRAA